MLSSPKNLDTPFFQDPDLFPFLLHVKFSDENFKWLLPAQLRWKMIPHMCNAFWWCMFISRCYTFEHWRQLPHSEATDGRVLTEWTLEEKQGHSSKYEGQKVRNQEGPCADTNREDTNLYTNQLTVIYPSVNSKQFTQVKLYDRIWRLGLGAGLKETLRVELGHILYIYTQKTLWGVTVY